jgi:hypothetical protein
MSSKYAFSLRNAVLGGLMGSLAAGGCTPLPSNARTADSAVTQDSATLDVGDSGADVTIFRNDGAAGDASLDAGTEGGTDVSTDLAVDAAIDVPADSGADVAPDLPTVTDAPVVIDVPVAIDVPVDVSSPDVPLPESRLLIGTFVSSGTSSPLLTGGFTWHGLTSGGRLEGWLH